MRENSSSPCEQKMEKDESRAFHSSSCFSPAHVSSHPECNVYCQFSELVNSPTPSSYPTIITATLLQPSPSISHLNYCCTFLSSLPSYTLAFQSLPLLRTSRVSSLIKYKSHHATATTENARHSTCHGVEVLQLHLPQPH